MTTYKALLIPADLSLPLQGVLITENTTSITKLVFDGGDGMIDFATFQSYGPETHERQPGAGVQLAFDDEGLMKASPVLNARAMWLWAWLGRRRIEDFTVPLVGNYVVLGVHNVSGEMADMPEEIPEILLDGVRAITGITEEPS